MALEDDLLRAILDYQAEFRRPAPNPYGVDDARRLELLRQAIASGDPEVDGHSVLPPHVVG